jgi:class 3 adenylate cyclase
MQQGTIASATPDAERRQLCVLFCDVVDSVPLSHQLDAEDLRDVMYSYRRACEGVVLRYGGLVAQYSGDGILIYFGYPAHEDDASRVVSCALEILEVVGQLANATKVDLRVRIGIHVGRVVVGPLESDGKPDAFGEPVNIAHRIMAEAEPGSAVVSDSLWRLLRGAFTAEPMGIRELKGVQRPIELFKLVTSGGPTAGPTVRKTPYIGRAGQRALVREVWARATSGVPQFVLLRGEPGIGKSRFLDVMQADLADDRFDVVAARCSPLTTHTALQPLIEVISSRLGLENATPAERLARIAKRMTELGIVAGEAVPLLASILSVPVDPTVWPAPNMSAMRARQRTMDILIEAIHGLARRGPALLVLEDLHWADPSTIELLHQLIMSQQGGTSMTLLTARPEFRPTWAAASNVTEIELEPLSPDEAETFIRKVACDKPLPPDVIWKIRERAAGNPLFLEEITRSVMESGALVQREHAWELIGTLSSDVVPASMDASLMARIDRLGDARPLLQLAATIGREFSHDLLVAVAQSSADAVRRQLHAMLQSGLVYRHGDVSPVYSFKHALVRDVAYDSLLRTTRQRYHARIAEVLVARFREVTQNRPELLAHHFSGAGFHKDAAARWQAAGENAAKRSAVNEAVAHLRRALTDLEKIPEDAARVDRELSVLTALAPALMAVYGWASSEVSDTCKRAIGLARRLGATDRIYMPLWGLWTNQFVGGRLGEAMETAAQVLAIGLAAGDPMLEMTGRHVSSYTCYYRGEYDASIAEAQAGLRHYTYELELRIAQTFQISTSTSGMTAKASSLWMKGHQDEGKALMDEVVAIARSLRNPPCTATALGEAMFFSLYDRDWKRLFAFADEVYNLAHAEGFAMWTANAGLHRGRARIGLGDADAGVAEVLEWGALFGQTGDGILVGSVTSMFTEALHLAGRSEEALLVSAEGARRAEAGHVRVMMPEIYRTRGNILRDLDRLDEADRAFCQAVACAQVQGARSLELRALTSLLDLRACRGPIDNLAGELRQALAAMTCRPDRPDVIAARKLLERICI